MNYYKRHIGDYAAKAGHLSPLEHGVYNLLIDAYYNREEAPTKPEAARWARARSTDELAALDAVLAEFFALEGDRYVQTRIEDEIAAYRETSETNKRIAANRESTKRARSVHEACEKRERFVEKREPSHKPLAISQEEAKAKAIERPVARFAEFWQAYPVKKGKAHAQARWKARGLDALADQIIADVRARLAGDRQWQEGYIPHGSTYVQARGWEDAIEPPKGKAAGPAHNPGGNSPVITGDEAKARERDALVAMQAQLKEYAK